MTDNKKSAPAQQHNGRNPVNTFILAHIAHFCNGLSACAVGLFFACIWLGHYQGAALGLTAAVLLAEK